MKQMKTRREYEAADGRSRALGTSHLPFFQSIPKITGGGEVVPASRRSRDLARFESDFEAACRRSGRVPRSSVVIVIVLDDTLAFARLASTRMNSPRVTQLSGFGAGDEIDR